jgi:hypothetical protein
MQERADAIDGPKQLPEQPPPKLPDWPDLRDEDGHWESPDTPPVPAVDQVDPGPPASDLPPPTDAPASALERLDRPLDERTPDGLSGDSAAARLETARNHYRDLGLDNVVDVAEGDLGRRSAFSSRTELQPNTLYEVEGRGRFITNDDGAICHVETGSGQVKRADPGREGWNPDLHNFLPDATYVVDDGYATYKTDHLGRVTGLHVDNLTLAANTLTEGRDFRNPGAQNTIGKEGGVDYDGGHLIARHFYGAGEKLNIVAMPSDLNRGLVENSFRDLELTWEKHLKEEPRGSVSVQMHLVYEGASTVPTDIRVEYRLDGQPPVNWSYKDAGRVRNS